MTAIGQSQDNPLSRYDPAIDHFTAIQKRDSFLYYTQLKLDLARQSDSLGAWAWTSFDRRNFFETDHAAALQCLDEAERNKWRTPANASEWEPFMYIRAARGFHLFHQGQVWQAIQAYEQARALFERYRCPDFDATDMIFKPLGNHYTRLGDNEKALIVFQEAAGLGGSPETLAGLYNNMGLANWNRGELHLAGANFQSGLQLTGISSEKKALLLSGLALVDLDNGKPRESLLAAEKALAGLPATARNPEALLLRARIRRTAGEAAMHMGQLDKAGRWLAGSLADARAVSDPWANRDIGKIQVTLSGWYRQKEQADAALEAANRALKAVVPGFNPQKLSDNPDPATFYEENTIFEALTAKAVAARLKYDQTGQIEWLQLALDCYDLCHTAESRLRSVFQYQSSKLWLQGAKRGREEQAMDVARLLYEKTGLDRYKTAGFAIAERSKAALLMDALRDNLIRRRLAGQDPRLGELAALERNVAELNTQCLLYPKSPDLAQWRVGIDDMNNRVNALKRAIFASYPEIVQPASVSSDLLQQINFGQDEMLAEYFISDRSMDVFTVRDGRIVAWDRRPFNADAQARIRLFAAYFRDANAIINDPGGYVDAAFQLWQLIAPPGIEGVKGLVVIPDGPLNELPFEALVTARKEASAGLGRAPYLIRQMPVRYAWSLASLRRQDAAVSKQTGSFMLGVAPLFELGDRGLAPLPGSRLEWTSAARWHPDVLMGPEAGADALLKKAGQYRLLHLATHAFAAASDYMLTRIELADRALLLPEIYALPLQADLVVLSACETGIGQDLKGEGVMSLSRAFAQAGAACIISSLWTVSDATIGSLFGEFYRKLGSGASISLSLRDAKLAYLDDPNVPVGLQTPYFWAGLIAVGSDKVIEGPASSGSWYVWAGLLIACILAAAIWRFRKHQKKTPS
jgi:hypothetical protein